MIPFDKKRTEFTFFLATALLIAYGHIYPFEFTFPAYTVDLIKLYLFSLVYAGITDTVSNIFLFIPLGFIAARACRPPLKPVSLTIRITIACFVFSYLLQAGQLFVESRVPSLLDSVFNTFGCAVGAYAGSVTTLRFFGGKRHKELWLSPPMLLAACMLLSILLPCVFSIDVGSIKEALKPVLVTPYFSTEQMLRYLTYWLVFAHLVSYTLHQRFTLVQMIVFISLILLSQVVIETRVMTLSKIIGSFAAIPAHVFATKRLSFRQKSSFLIFLLFSVHTLYALSPFDFSKSPGNFNWLPFAGFMHGSMLHNTIVFVEKLFLFGSMMWLFEEKSSRWEWYTLFCFLWAGSMEGLQLFLSGHTPETSDPLLILLIAFWLRQYRHLKHKVPVDARQDPAREQRRRKAQFPSE